MDEMRRLVTALREHAAGLKDAAMSCMCAEDKFALVVRADEAERCVAAIENAMAAGDAPATETGKKCSTTLRNRGRFVGPFKLSLNPDDNLFYIFDTRTEEGKNGLPVKIKERLAIYRTDYGARCAAKRLLALEKEVR